MIYFIAVEFIFLAFIYISYFDAAKKNAMRRLFVVEIAQYFSVAIAAQGLIGYFFRERDHDSMEILAQNIRMIAALLALAIYQIYELKIQKSFQNLMFHLQMILLAIILCGWLNTGFYVPMVLKGAFSK